MSYTTRPLWFEGQLVSPQHLQQLNRWTEDELMRRQNTVAECSWGVHSLRFDESQLAIGKVAPVQGRIIFPDGTIVDFPDRDQTPAPLQIDPDTTDALVWLTLPLRNGDGQEVGEKQRLFAASADLRDSTGQGGGQRQVVTAGYNTALTCSVEHASGVVRVPLCRILRVNATGAVQLDRQFAPPSLRSGAHPLFQVMAREVQGIVAGRAMMLARRVDPARGGTDLASMLDFMLLQTLNSAGLIFAWLGADEERRPSDYYAELLRLLGAVSTFGRETRLPEAVEPWHHADPGRSLVRLTDMLRFILSDLSVDTAIALPLENRAVGLWVSLISDRVLLENARFVVMASASLESEQLRRILPGVTKVAAAETVQEIVSLQLPGIPLRPLPVAPRELPYRSGTVYFELDRTSSLWQQLLNSSAFVIHVGNIVPDLKLEFWALRQR